MTAQKRKAEKDHPKGGTGNAPKMTHYNEGRVIKVKLNDIIEESLRQSEGPKFKGVLNEKIKEYPFLD